MYLDAFAGEGFGIDRLTGEEFKGSARIALDVADPQFTRLRYFELPERALAWIPTLGSRVNTTAVGISRKPV
jgi:hypothetical protein